MPRGATRAWTARRDACSRPGQPGALWSSFEHATVACRSGGRGVSCDAKWLACNGLPLAAALCTWHQLPGAPGAACILAECVCHGNMCKHALVLSCADSRAKKWMSLGISRWAS